MNQTHLNADAAHLKTASNKAKEAYLAAAFILGSDRNRYGKMLEDMENDFTTGIDKYPKTLVNAYNLLLHWKQNPRNLARIPGSPSDGVAFATTGTEADRNGRRPPRRDKSDIECYNCGDKGHYANECPKETTERTGTQMLLAGVESGDYDQKEHVGFNFLQEEAKISHHHKNGRKRIPSNWILLDNQSTIDVFANMKLLTNVRQLRTTMNISCNAGVTSTNQVGELPGYRTVWYHPDGIANILSLSRVKEKYRVTYDSRDGGQFEVHKPDGCIRTFRQSDSGSYYMDAGESVGTVLINTVDGNKSRCTNRDYSRALLARKLQSIIGHPSNRGFARIVGKNQLRNCPVRSNDIRVAEDILGPNLGSIKGKKSRRSVPHVRPEYVDVPPEILERHRTVTLCIDLMFVNGTPYLVTTSRNIRLGTVEVLKNRNKKTIFAALKKAVDLYKKRGFKIVSVMADNEFEPLRADVTSLGPHLNVVANNEHVPEVERFIRTIKERTRSVYNTVTFKRMPTRMIIEMVYASVF